MTDQAVNTLSKTETFQLEEYKALRAEIIATFQLVQTQEQLAVAAVGLNWSWLVAQSKTNFFLWLVPFFVVLVLYWRVKNLMDGLFIIGWHLRSIEASFNWNGWEHRFDEPDSKPKLQSHIQDYLLEFVGLIVTFLAALLRNKIVHPK